MKKLSLLFLSSVINLILNSLPTIQSITSGKKRNHLFIFSTMHLTLGDAVVSLRCPDKVVVYYKPFVCAPIVESSWWAVTSQSDDPRPERSRQGRPTSLRCCLSAPPQS